MREELLKGLTQEQIAKVKACKNQEELLKLAKEEGIELSDDQLEAVSGGMCTSTPEFCCPNCGKSGGIGAYVTTWTIYYDCRLCGYTWETPNNNM